MKPRTFVIVVGLLMLTILFLITRRAAVESTAAQPEPEQAPTPVAAPSVHHQATKATMSANALALPKRSPEAQAQIDQWKAAQEARDFVKLSEIHDSWLKEGMGQPIATNRLLELWGEPDQISVERYKHFGEFVVWRWDAGQRQRYIVGGVALGSPPIPDRPELYGYRSTPFDELPEEQQNTITEMREYVALYRSLSDKARSALNQAQWQRELLRPGFGQPSPLDTGKSHIEEMREFAQQYP